MLGGIRLVLFSTRSLPYIGGMEFRNLGSTGLLVSAISFGAGPVSQLLVGQNQLAQRSTVEQALELGINWFDTAATYGEGQSEENLGRTLAELGATGRVHVASKVRVMPHQLTEIGRTVRDSVMASLKRLRLERMALLQIHNSITEQVGEQPTSISPAHVLAADGVLDTMQKLQQEGLIEHLGLTGLGDPRALTEVIETGAFAAIQIPYNLLNSSAGRHVQDSFPEDNYGNLITLCGQRNMGVFAIRVLAGGALAGQPPSPHTLKTPFFPLDLYRRDCARARKLSALLPQGVVLEEAAVRFALSHSAVTSAIVGFATPEQVFEIADYAAHGPLDSRLLARLNDDIPPETPSGN